MTDTIYLLYVVVLDQLIQYPYAFESLHECFVVGDFITHFNFCTTEG